MGSPYEEMDRDGEMGPVTYALFIDLIPRAASWYPPPPGYKSWSREASSEWFHSYFLEHKGHATAVKLYALATDDESFENLAFRAIARALIDWARATAPGRLQKRLKGILPADSILDAKAVLAGQDGWTLPALGESIFSGDWRELLAAPGLRMVGVISVLNEGGPTSAHNRRCLSDAAHAILSEAGGAMRARELACALVEHFELGDPDLYLLFDDDLPDSDASLLEEPGERVEAVEQADIIWSALNVDERLVLCLLPAPLATIKVVVPTATATFVSGLEDKLRALVVRDDTAQAVLGIVRARSLDMHAK
ncbi:hypothetical protein [Microbacterium sp. USTB-Y]|uniref:hypothetical protein n=1 Tax=Microbacterium sp. USTB-Y TaxID=2823692 RepID=UPI00203D9C15|nr:hypothetical protein [Microbacterium sp. USTB-Y]